MRFNSPSLLCALALLTPLASQGTITLLEGADAADRTIRIIDEEYPSSGGAVLMAGVEILPIDLATWYRQLMTRQYSTRHVARLGLERVELPANGRLLKYRRDAGAFYGVLWLRAPGDPVVLLELAGAGSSGTLDPFAPKLGVSLDGRFAALQGAQGRLWLARLDGQTYASGALTMPVATRGVVDNESLAVGRTSLFHATDDDRVWRVGLSSGRVEDVTPTLPAGSDLDPEMALSGDGETVAFVAGPPHRRSVYVLRDSGMATALPAPPGDYVGAAYGNPLGPCLWLNHSGSRLMFMEITGVGHHGNPYHFEIYRADTSGAVPPFHITSGENFHAYIGTGVIPADGTPEPGYCAALGQPSAGDGPLIMAIGYPEQFDWYAVSMANTLTNLTQTNGQTLPPFEQGTLNPSAGCSLSNGQMITIEDNGVGGARLRGLFLDGRPSVILEPDLQSAPQLGDAVDDTPTHVVVPGALRDRILGIDDLQTIYQSQPRTRVSGLVVGIQGKLSMFLESNAHGRGRLVFLTSFGAIKMPPEKGLRQAVVTASGGLLLNGSKLRYAPAGAGLRVISAHRSRIVLSGVGA